MGTFGCLWRYKHLIYDASKIALILITVYSQEAYGTSQKKHNLLLYQNMDPWMSWRYLPLTKYKAPSCRFLQMCKSRFIHQSPSTMVKRFEVALGSVKTEDECIPKLQSQITTSSRRCQTTREKTHNVVKGELCRKSLYSLIISDGCEIKANCIFFVYVWLAWYTYSFVCSAATNRWNKC